jgi:excisionase family DNA binding protein
MANFRLPIALLAALLLVLSINPLRRRLPGLRRAPAGIDLILWVAFVTLCLAAISSVRTARANELAQAVARAAFDVTGRSIDSSLSPAIRWVSLHQPGIALITLAAAGLAWLLVAGQVSVAVRRAFEPRPHLNDWWVLKPAPREGPRIEVLDAPPAPSRAALAPTIPAPAVVPLALVDAHAAAVYLGVSQATVYRWARGGRLRYRRAGTKLRFSSGDLAALREPDSAETEHA